jgi:hypothetical protein
MDIKDVSELPPQVADVGRPTRVQSPAASRETPLSQLPAAEDYDDLTVSAPVRAPVELRKLNEAIEATNLATEAVTKIGQMLTGSQGTSAQSADSADLTQEDTTDSVGTEVFKGAGADAPPVGAADLGDSIRVELEEMLGKTLEIILPSSDGAASGFQAVNFSAKDLILDTVAKVEAARKGIEALRTKLALGVGTLQGSADAVSASGANSSGTGRLRDVEQVWTAARETRDGITGQPELALGVVGDIKRNAPALLQ